MQISIVCRFFCRDTLQSVCPTVQFSNHITSTRALHLSKQDGRDSANHDGGADQRSFSFLDVRRTVLCDQDVLSCYGILRAESLSTSGS